MGIVDLLAGTHAHVDDLGHTFVGLQVGLQGLLVVHSGDVSANHYGQSHVSSTSLSGGDLKSNSDVVKNTIVGGEKECFA